MTRVFLISALLLLSNPAAARRGASGTPQNGVRDNHTSATNKNKKLNIKEILGKERAASVSKAKRINVYHVSGFVTDAVEQRQGDGKYFVDYEVLGVNKVNTKEVKALKKALLDPRNYVGPDNVNKCTFTATLGLEIISRKETVNALISYPCRKILFIKDGKEFYMDLKSVESFDQIAQAFFTDLPKSQ